MTSADAQIAAAAPGLLTPALSLCQREIVRFLRQRHRVIGALATPLVFWILIGAGMGRSFRGTGVDNGNYLQFFFPGTVLMILLFTAIFSTIIRKMEARLQREKEQSQLAKQARRSRN